MFSSNTSQVSNDVKYIEDFCSVYLRTGTGSSQTVTTGIKENTGALVISKSRSAATDWAWYDTFRGATKELASNTTAAEITQSQGLTSFNTDGHTWGTLAKVNTSGATYVDFVLKPTPKFFDVVTFTTSSTTNTNQRISHSLGSAPGMIILKATNAVTGWPVYHKDLNGGGAGAISAYLLLNDTAAFGSYSNVFGTAVPTSTDFGINTNFFSTNTAYVAYVLASDAGGFGLSGTDNVISCGSFVGTGGISSINLGYEPQWLLFKDASSGTADWQMYDTMRGFAVGSNSSQRLNANTSGAETVANYPKPTATGFEHAIAGGNTCIYIAIRRGPMKTPTTGTSVFAVQAPNTGTSFPYIISNFPVDLGLVKSNKTATASVQLASRLQGDVYLQTATTDAEAAAGGTYAFDSNKGWANLSGANLVSWMFRRAPGFFDAVCYTGTGSATTQTHNLGVVPELMIVKRRTNNDGAGFWAVYSAATGATKFLTLNATSAENTNSTFWNDTAPTSSVFTVGTITRVNGSGETYVAYLFATCAGVSKVGSYTGTGTTQVINCGFAAGSRFVLIKRTDSTGDWYVWDSARGIVAGDDPYLLLNSTAAEVTNTDWVDTAATGFELSNAGGNLVNISGSTYVFLAIA